MVAKKIPHIFTIILVLTLIMQAKTFAETPPMDEQPAEPKEITAADMVPHKALYNIKMVAKRSSSQVLNISGQMFYEWKPTCDAWISEHRFNLFYEYADNPSLNITSDFSTYETFDGKDFNFTSRRKRGGELYQELRGHAHIEDNGFGKASYTMPDDLSFDLSEGTLFPMQHTLNVMKHAHAGKTFYSATIFDGSDKDGPVEVNTFIGKEVNAMAVVDPSADLDTTLINTPAKKIRMAFFPVLDPASDAEYEMNVVFHENGIISDMLIEYRDFSVVQKIAALEKIEKISCNNDDKEE
jgi:hypothetical protein